MAAIDLLRDDLLRIQESAEPEPTDRRLAEPLAVPGPAESLGTCGLCGARPAVRRCLNCETPACKDDYWVMMGLCKRCATPAELQAARDGSLRPRPDLGIKWVED